MIIISASGMAETGRILHHLKNNIENPLNTICIVSWQAPYTLGRRLADREKQVKIFGEPYTRQGGDCNDRRLIRSRGAGFADEICAGREEDCEESLPCAWRRKAGRGAHGKIEGTEACGRCIIPNCIRAWKL